MSHFGWLHSTPVCGGSFAKEPYKRAYSAKETYNFKEPTIQHTDMWWLRLVDFFKHIYVSFAEYSLFYRALLQKRPIISRSLQIVATTYRYAV